MSTASSSKRKASRHGGPTSAKTKKSKGNQHRVSSSSLPAPSKQERQSHRKHADSVADGKRIWNQLRLKTNTKEQTRKLVEELMPLLTGKASEVALQHDGSRLVQAAFQFGNDQERQQILNEICVKESFLDICKSQYAHFVILKALKYCKGSIKKLVQSFKAHMSKLAVHATASRVVESLFQSFPKETVVLKQELYGPHFALFAADALKQIKSRRPTLQANLELAPERKDATVDYCRNLVSRGMEKQLYGFTYFQEYMLELMQVISPKEIRTLASTGADHAIHLLTCRPGTHILALWISYGTAKDRKRILKSLKGYSRSALLHHDAYLAVMRLVQLTDDTVAVQKNLLQELTSKGPTAAAGTMVDGKKNNDGNNDESPLLDIALSDTGSKLFLLVLNNKEDEQLKFLDPYERSVLFAKPTVTEDGSEVPTSKKDPAIRRRELLKHLSEPLLELCSKHADQLVTSIPGSAVLLHIYKHLQRPSVLVVKAVLEACEASLSSRDQEVSTSLFEHVVGHRSIKNLILADTSNADDDLSPECFATQFVVRLENRLSDIASTNRGAFVVAALCKDSGLCKRVSKELNVSILKKRAKKDGPTAGFQALLKVM